MLRLTKVSVEAPAVMLLYVQQEALWVSSSLTSLCLISWQTWTIFIKPAANLYHQHSSLPVYSLILNPHLSLCSLSLFFSRDTAINLWVANELHLTIKCTGNGTFHLQEDQWQWQTPCSKWLVSGMMFRRQSNQSPHTNAEINQRMKWKGEKGLEAFIFVLHSCSLFN